jgi:NAD(P)-dependent dehydrogenase (short-subunit alcohol dehydrogenase family)
LASWHGRQEQLDAALLMIGGLAQAIQGGVTNSADLERLFNIVRKSTNQLDILVTSSGISEYAMLDTLTEEHFDKTFNLNVRGMVFTVQRAVQQMVSGSTIVLIGSIAGSIGNPGFSTYSATKAAVRSYARSWTHELAGRGIRINTLSPGPTDTPMFDAVSEEVRKSLSDRIPMKRLGLSEEIAAAALFLASAESNYIAGAELSIDGGITA